MESSESSELKTSAARGSAVTIASQILRMVLQLTSVVILARMIAPENFGKFAMVAAVTSLATIFLDFGLSMAALRAPNLSQQQHSNLFWINSAAGLLLALIVFILAPVISSFYSEPALLDVTRWLSVAYVVGGLTAQFRVRLNKDLRFTALAVGELLGPAFGLILAVVLASHGYGLAALVAQQLVAAFVLLVVAVIAARWTPSLPRRTAGMRPLLSFGLTFAGTQTMSYMTQNVDSIVIGRFTGAGQLGLYDRAYRLSVVPVTQIAFPLTRVAMPILSRILDSPQRVLKTLRDAQLVTCYLIGTLLILVAGLGEPLVQLLFGTEWIEAAPILSLLCLAATFRVLQQVANWALMAYGMGSKLFRFNLVIQPTMILIIVSGVPWGAVGVALGVAVAYGVYWLASLWWSARCTGLNLMHLLGRALRIILVVSLPPGLFAYYMTSAFGYSPLALVVTGVLIGVLWFLICAVMVPFVRNDVLRIISIIKLVLPARLLRHGGPS